MGASGLWGRISFAYCRTMAMISLYRKGLMTWFLANLCIPLKGLSCEPQLSRQASLTTNANPLLSFSCRACLTSLRLLRAAFLTPLHLWCTHSEAHPLSLASSALAPPSYDWTLCILQLRQESPELCVFSPVIFFFSNHFELSNAAATFSLLFSQGKTTCGDNGERRRTHAVSDVAIHGLLTYHHGSTWAEHHGGGHGKASITVRLGGSETNKKETETDMPLKDAPPVASFLQLGSSPYFTPL